MKHAATLLAAEVALASAAQAPAQDPAQIQAAAEKPQVVVLETDDKGQPAKVKIGEREIYVCNAQRQDSCVNPRDAGFDFGKRELTYWPGKPASEIEQPLPATREQAVEQGIISEDQPAPAAPSEVPEQVEPAE